MQIPALTSILAFTALTVTVSVNPGLSQEIPKQEISFACRSISYPGNTEKVPTTMAFVPDKKSNPYVPIIAWKSNSFPSSEWTPKRRCEQVSKKFQQFYQQGRLDYLTTGKLNGLGVICAAKPGECNKNNILFSVRPGVNPVTVLAELNEIREGRTSDLTWQNSGENTYLNLGEYLKNISK
jgi:hypothetical protein